MTAALLFAFAAGAVATVNPCGLALLPVWFARQMAERGGDILATLRAGLGATAGFVLVFGIAGAILGAGIYWIGTAVPYIGFAIGILVTLAGVLSLFGKGAALLPGARTCRRISDRHGNVVFGISYGLLSLSCTLPVFMAAVGIALTENPLAALGNLLAYAAGMGTVLTVLGLAAGMGRSGFGTLSERGMRVLRLVTAGLVILAGAYITYYWGRVIFGDVMVENPLVSAGDSLSTTLRGWIGGRAGRWVTGLAFALLAGFAVRRLMRRG